jgi:hypothetical protein
VLIAHCSLFNHLLRSHLSFNINNLKPNGNHIYQPVQHSVTLDFADYLWVLCDSQSPLVTSNLHSVMGHVFTNDSVSYTGGSLATGYCRTGQRVGDRRNGYTRPQVGVLLLCV